MQLEPARSVTVSLDDIEAALARVLATVRREHGDVMELSADHYWQLELQDVFDVGGPPDVEALGAGQLSDDVASLREVARRADVDDVHPWHDLQQIIGVLQRLAALDLPEGRPGAAARVRR